MTVTIRYKTTDMTITLSRTYPFLTVSQKDIQDINEWKTHAEVVHIIKKELANND